MSIISKPPFLEATTNYTQFIMNSSIIHNWFNQFPMLRHFSFWIISLSNYTMVYILYTHQYAHAQLFYEEIFLKVELLVQKISKHFIQDCQHSLTNFLSESLWQFILLKGIYDGVAQCFHLQRIRIFSSAKSISNNCSYKQ